MTIRGAEGRKGIMGRAGFGQNYIYFNSNLLRTKVREDAMSWTGKTINRKGVLFRTFSHQFGYSAGLEGYPLQNDAPGNLMLQSRKRLAGTEITEEQINIIKNYYRNKGKQEADGH
ncbi:hypothetical protein [Flammeovirga kamogawensis]|uniref:Uncharacterized protein n=1 Tax=Flammeovirga kamogawensis TaxID=373891 RepID=A0ABX8H498_9BACT|nr:hypothetical protein [Flammeovirga kamogawensis]MBB6460353.1 hypothetical protein [Flammeovirga kamogawensis]QWG10162.1 hypothetical protein KM029_20990 [Flammeovirga kamogawensis]TRX64614.1 hypothetical protein EO216_18920 [Flammeovirga kamogawensis]